MLYVKVYTRANISKEDLNYIAPRWRNRKDLVIMRVVPIHTMMARLLLSIYTYNPGIPGHAIPKDYVAEGWFGLKEV